MVGHQAFGEMALHFIEQYGMMAIKIPSKFDLRRFCRATGEGGEGGRVRPGGRAQQQRSWDDLHCDAPWVPLCRTEGATRRLAKHLCWL